MARRRVRDMTLEEFDAWSKSSSKYEEVTEAADEEGGPRLSLVPAPEQGDPRPTDLLPPASMPFDGVALEDSKRRLAGWSAER